MKTVGVKIQIAAGNEKTAEAFSKKLLCGYVSIPPCWNSIITYLFLLLIVKSSVFLVSLLTSSTTCIVCHVLMSVFNEELFIDLLW